MASHFENKVVLVTGGTAGIGEATARAFARSGAKVAVAGRDQDRGEKIVAALQKGGAESMFVPADVSKSDQVEAMIEQTLERFGRLDIAFNNAGVVQVGQRTPDITEEKWNETIATNLTGVWLCMKYEIPAMGKSGVIVNNASISAVQATDNMAAYVASKHGVLGLTKVAAREHAAKGIRINAVCPGFVETEMTSGVRHETISARVPLGRKAAPEEIADAVLWLCSPASEYMIGHGLVVDGGAITG